MADAIPPSLTYKKKKGASIKLIIPIKVQDAATLALSPMVIEDFDFTIRESSTLAEITGCTFTKAGVTLAAAAAAKGTVPVADAGWLRLFIPGSFDPASIINRPSFELSMFSYPKVGELTDNVARLIIKIENL